MEFQRRRKLVVSIEDNDLKHKNLPHQNVTIIPTRLKMVAVVLVLMVLTGGWQCAHPWNVSACGCLSPK